MRVSKRICVDHKNGQTKTVACPPKKPGQMLSYTLDLKTGRQGMKRRQFTPEQIITMLREAKVLLSQGSTAVEVARKLGIVEQAYYRWRRECGGCILNKRRD